jgi:lipopolysaccharide transport system permease protein
MNALAEECRAAWRARALVWVMARREIAARSAGSAGGWLWSYVQPLLMVAAYYFVFDVVFAMRLGDNAPTRAVGAFLVVGALPWMAFCDAVSRSMNSLVEAGTLLQRSPLPAVLFPVRSTVASAVIFLPIMLLLVLAYAPLHRFSPALVAYPLLLAVQAVLSLLLGWLLAIFVAAIRDTLQVVGFLLAIGIFASPILFPIGMVPEAWRWALWLNPMTGPVLGYQSLLLQGAWPEPVVWLATAAWIAGIGAALTLVIARSRDQLVDWL